jgi:hypothetical protein
MSGVAADAAARTDWSATVHPRITRGLRIASLVPSLTELLFALGLGESVVARTGFCVHPRGAVRRVPKIGGTKDPDLTALRALAPTHLIVNVDENRRDVVDAARAYIPRVVVTHPCAPEDNARLYSLFGALFGREAEAAALCAALRGALDRCAAIGRTLPREQVVYLIWKKPWMTVSRDTYVSATLARAGWDTLPARAALRYPALPDDDPAWREAERILVASEPYAFRERDALALAAAHGKPALRIDGEMTSWYGPRAIVGLRYLAELRRSLAGTTGP